MKVQRIVLAGGGHTHALVLLEMAKAPLPGVELVLVSVSARAPYSGMMPGHIAGYYEKNEMSIDLSRLAARAGATFMRAAVTGVDVTKRELLLEDQPALAYDVLSLNVGSVPHVEHVPGAARFATPAKPVFALLEAIERLKQQALEQPRIVVVGSGAAGFELALAVRSRLGAHAQVVLVGRDTEIGMAYPKHARFFLKRALVDRGIALELGSAASTVTASAVVLASGREIPFDLAIWATEGRAPPWLQSSGLALTRTGFIRVHSTLQTVTDPRVFAVGDVATLDGYQLPKSGVYAVREAPILAANLRYLLCGKPLLAYYPQRRALALLSTGDGRAYYVRGWRVAWGRWVWRLKDRIDRRFMAQFPP